MLRPTGYLTIRYTNNMGTFTPIVTMCSTTMYIIIIIIIIIMTGMAVCYATS